jgi:hypothetical protein
MKIFLLFICVFISGKLLAQPSDFLLLKKHDKTIASFYRGTNISIITTSGVGLTAEIRSIKNDSIFLTQYIVRRTPTDIGEEIIDTTGSYPYQFSFNEIKSVVLPGRHFNLFSSGASLFGGGVVLVVVSGVIYVADRDNFSPALMIAGGVLATAGYFLARKDNTTAMLGKKYKLVYVEATANQNQ